MREYSLLSKIDSPADLKKLDESQLPLLCSEIREFIIDTLSNNPGHFGASLGTVELTVALHYVFDTPDDKLIWDVGHQAYTHKIITGRRDIFHTNRKKDGISGFPKMKESEYDAFGVGHSSTSISAALGMAVASKLKGESHRHHVAIIGDGAMSGGEAFEGLNNVSASKANILVILNDNGISIDKGVGSLQEFLLEVTTSRAYNKIKDKTWDALGHLGTQKSSPRMIVQYIGRVAKKLLRVKENNFMKALKMRYYGVVDGHDVIKLVKLLRGLKEISDPKLLHISTTKGKGFEQAERHQTTFHAPGKFDKETGKLIEDNTSKNLPPKYQDVFGETLVELASLNNKIVGITPAMPSGCSMNLMMEAFPNRAFDVGIAEQHAVTYSAGLAAKGMIPFCNIYSTFLQRAFDQIIHDVALQKLPVIFCIDRGGLVGEDGPTHHGVFDLAFLRMIPNIVIAAPANEIELRNLMFTAQQETTKLPMAIRYPRGRGVIVDWKKPFEILAIGKSELMYEGDSIMVIALGHPVNFAKEAVDKAKAEGLNIGLLNLRFLKPFDQEKLHAICTKYNHIITVEDGTIVGGLGSAISEFILNNAYSVGLTTLGVPDRFIEHGKPSELYAECGFDSDGIYKTIHNLQH